MNSDALKLNHASFEGDLDEVRRLRRDLAACGSKAINPILSGWGSVRQMNKADSETGAIWPNR